MTSADLLPDRRVVIPRIQEQRQQGVSPFTRRILQELAGAERRGESCDPRRSGSEAAKAEAGASAKTEAAAEGARQR